MTGRQARSVREEALRSALVGAKRLAGGLAAVSAMPVAIDEPATMALAAPFILDRMPQILEILERRDGDRLSAHLVHEDGDDFVRIEVDPAGARDKAEWKRLRRILTIGPDGLSFEHDGDRVSLTWSRTHPLHVDARVLTEIVALAGPSTRSVQTLTVLETVLDAVRAAMTTLLAAAGAAKRDDPEAIALRRADHAIHQCEALLDCVRPGYDNDVVADLERRTISAYVLPPDGPLRRARTMANVDLPITPAIRDGLPGRPIMRCSLDRMSDIDVSFRMDGRSSETGLPTDPVALATLLRGTGTDGSEMAAAVDTAVEAALQAALQASADATP